MLGNVRSYIFFFLGFCFIYTTPFCQRNSQNQRTHTTQTIHEMFLFFFVMVIVVSSHVRATESASHLVETVMKYFIHPPPPHPCQPIKMFYRNHDLSEVFCKFDCCILLRSNDNVFTGKCFIMSICFGVYMHSDDSVSFSPTRGSNRTHLDK